MEAFWARDILELFRLERRSSFLKFAELLLAQSGGQFKAASFAPLTWRDKDGHEVDFIWAPRGAELSAIEVKRSANALELAGIRAFRALHPECGGSDPNY
jgi:hypothetical protein